MNDPHATTRSEQAARERVAELVRAVDVPAPERLHERVEAMVAESGRGTTPASSSRRARADAPREHPSRGLIAARLKPTLAAMAVAAAAGVTIALLTGGGTQQQQQQQRGPSVGAASRLTLSAATTGAPSESRAHATQLNVAVDGVSFPYWEDRFGWRATGARTDTIGGREVTAVYYSSPGAGRIGYAIVGGTPAPAASGGTVVWHGGVDYRLLHAHGVPVVTWQRDGRLCVLSGRGVSGATLVRLASWGDGSSTT